ncbi:MAG TPA: hypothetical protein VE819_05265 [Steroidobacteraceae bacterium]|jgi:hypothetical protein|nr:hypothetical protein [Steroidobacteraceae bacterium]
MRICDDRYRRERARMELALRFLHHEARTQTIRTWTGLSDDRIRKLYRSYMSHARRALPRHRGKSPHQVAYFTRSLRLQEESALLASMLSLLDVVPTPAPGESMMLGQSLASARVASAVHASGPVPLADVKRGESLCEAFEAFRLLLPGAQISFEHAVFLATALARGDQLRLGDCSGCGSLMVTERFPLRLARCAHCASPAQSRAHA